MLGAVLVALQREPAAGPLQMIEVQVGERVEEDDITRYEDVYGREKA